ncbi:hypothetical protein [Rhodoblastus sp.]|uniref:hypothetical protein n=1 Tax=Rhodoblastus sp. TaxID=1962975 RepID=UPI003F9C03CD
MSYLYPPPGDAPVVVMKDVGGYVDQYGAQTARYLASNREVQLHECRSACTLALSLPNVCVYPSSILKFHKAYNPITRNANEAVSDSMMAVYPAAVRQRLGVLTRQYKILTGSELIRLGIRDCNAPREPRIMIARAKAKENPPQNPVSNAFAGLVAALAPQTPSGSGAPVKIQPVTIQPVKVQTAQAAPAVPLPPQRAEDDPAKMVAATPAKPATAIAETTAAPTESPVAPTSENPTPPPRPADLATGSAPIAQIAEPVLAPPAPEPRPNPLAAAAPTTPFSHWGRRIKGSAPILVTARFSPFPYRIASR